MTRLPFRCLVLFPTMSSLFHFSRSLHLWGDVGNQLCKVEVFLLCTQAAASTKGLGSQLQSLILI